MMLSTRSSEYLYQTLTGVNRVGSQRREKEISSLAELEMEHWRDLGMAWLGNERWGNSHLRISNTSDE